MPDNDGMLDIIRLYGKVIVHPYDVIVFYRPGDSARFGSTVESIFDMLVTWMKNEVMDIEIEGYEE
jgi:hypothetical protein